MCKIRKYGFRQINITIPSPILAFFPFICNMKYTLLLIIAVWAFAGCSKNNSAPQPEPEPEIVKPADTSLAGKLNLKITDKENLVLTKKLFQDSKGNYIIEGKKSGKHWIGCFDKNGNEIVVKSYTDGPDVFISPGGSVIPVMNNKYPLIKEVNNFLCLVRQIYPDSTIYSYPEFYLEEFTKINLTEKKIMSEYNNVYGEGPYIQDITPWYKGFYRISRFRNFRFDPRPYLTSIFDEADKKVAEFETFYGPDNNMSGYLAVSENSFVCIRLVGGSALLRSWNYQATHLYYEKLIFSYKVSDEGVKINSMKLINDAIEIDITLTDTNGNKTSRLVKVDPSTGKVL